MPGGHILVDVFVDWHDLQDLVMDQMVFLNPFHVHHLFETGVPRVPGAEDSGGTTSLLTVAVAWVLPAFLCYKCIPYP